MTLTNELKKASVEVKEPTLIGGTTHKPKRMMPDKYISLSALKKICSANELDNWTLEDAISELEKQETTKGTP